MSKPYHFLKFSLDDWENDLPLMSCSDSAQAIWLRLLKRMMHSERVGFLQINGKPIGIDFLAKSLGRRIDWVKKIIQELTDKGVCSVTEEGVIYSRRMVRDFEEFERSRCNGKKGGNPHLKLGKAEENSNLTQEKSNLKKDKLNLSQDNLDNNGGNQPENDDRGLTLEYRYKNIDIRKEKDIPNGISKKKAADASTTTAPEPIPKQKRKNGTRLPEDWEPDEECVAFAKSLGLNAADVADQFCDYWHSKTGQGATKLDWSATWRNWCRKDRQFAGKSGVPQTTKAKDDFSWVMGKFKTIRPDFTTPAPESEFGGTTIDGSLFH